MSTSLTNSDYVVLILRNTLEYNASVTALAAVYAGNVTTSKVHKQFIREYERLSQKYEKRQSELLELMASDHENQWQKPQDRQKNLPLLYS